MMGTARISWKTFLSVFVISLQIQVITGIKSKFVSGTEGEMFDFKCEYSIGQETRMKYFHRDDAESDNYKTMTKEHDVWVRQGRFSMYDNTTGAFFIVRVDKLYLNDSGRYRCGVSFHDQPDHISIIHLDVSKVTNVPDSTNNHKFTQQLLLVALLCVAAMIFVCLFTIFLQLAMKQRRSASCKKRQTSSDYETMMPGVKNEPEHCCCCTLPDDIDLSALPPPPPELCANFSFQQRESIMSFSHGDYADVDVPGHICQYQHLDLSLLDEHVYHCLHEKNCPKHIIH